MTLVSFILICLTFKCSMIKRIVFSNFFKSQIMYGYNLNSTYYLTILCIYLQIYLINKEGNRYLHLYTHCAIHMIYSSVQNLIVHLVTLDLKDLGYFCNLSKKKIHNPGIQTLYFYDISFSQFFFSYPKETYEVAFG